jgi:GT2 family glycosyltransferase
MTEMLASVVIPVQPRDELLGECLDRVRRQDYPRKEIIVACDPRAAELAAGFGGSEEVRVSAEREPCDLSRLIGAGMRAARGHVKVLLLPHCIPVGAGWLRSLLEPFERDDVGVVVSQCLAMEGTDPGLGTRLMDAAVPIERRCSGPGPTPQAGVSHLCDAYRASLLADIGYFAGDGLPAAAQAVDVSIRVKDAGYCILLSDTAAVSYRVPHGRKGLRQAFAAAWQYGHADALIERAYETHWLNAGVPAAALLALLLLPLAAVNRVAALALSGAVFLWGAFLSVRVPLLRWECPVAAVNFAAWAAIVLQIRGDWWPQQLGREVHPAIIRQWCWLIAVTGSYVVLLVWYALRGAWRAASRPRGAAYAVPVLALGLAWWLLAGLGYVSGRWLARPMRE